MEESVKILEKVRALLSKTIENGATESEVEAALKMAQKLIVKYNIDQSELLMSENDISITLIENAFKHGEAKFWIWDLLEIIGKGYNCVVLRKGYTDHYFWKIISFDQDRKMVVGMYETCLPLIRNLVKKRFEEKDALDLVYHRKRTSKGIFTRSYIEGFLVGLNMKLQKDKEEYLKLEDKTKYELIVIKKDDLIEAWREIDREGRPKTFANSNPRERQVDEIAQLQGYQDGKEESYNQKLH